MREPYTQLYLHLVWATWDRLPLLSQEVEAAVYKCIHAKCKELGVDVIAVGGVMDHVHLLVRFPATLSVAVLVKQVKGDSSHLVNHRFTKANTFKWQGAYGAFTVSKGNVLKVRDYVLRQKEHHADGTIHTGLELPSR